MSEKSLSRKAKAARWHELIAEHAMSGQSVLAFCRERNVSSDTFKYWRRKISFTPGEAPGQTLPSRFIAVSGGCTASPTFSDSPRITLPNGVTIDLRVGLDSPGARLFLLNLCGVSASGGSHAKS